MKNVSDGPIEKREAGKDDATKPFPNSEKKSAKEINEGGDKETRYYKNGKPEPQGPNYDSESVTVDGDTTVNAGTFK